MKRDVPIPWSVSLPCVVALGALILGWRAFSKPTKPTPPSPVTASAPAPAEVKAPPPVEAPTPVAPPAREPAPAEASAPPSVDATNWLALSALRADDLPAAANDAAARALLKLRDRLGAAASTLFTQSVANARVLVVVAADARAERGDAAVRTLAAFGERLQARILVPAHLDAAFRPWVALYLGDAADLPDFDGVVWSVNEAAPLAAIAERQLRGALARGPEARLLPWTIAGAAGVAACTTLNDALVVAEPLPSLSAVMKWGERDAAIELARGATSFAAFCLARGPRDPAATGFFDLLKTDARLLPTTEEAREGEVASRLGATRLEELEAAWRGARR